MTPVGPCQWSFPPAGEWPDSDVVGYGADLEPSTLIHAYRHGMFPMHVDRRRSVIGWWSPLRRGILPLDGLRVSRSLRKSVSRLQVTFDREFDEVVRRCGRGDRPHGWITDDIARAYVRLHEMGWAHSVETRTGDGRLVGGLYGVRIGGLFAGESMFHDATDASKVALVALTEWMKERGMTLLDTQWATDHLQSLGVIEVPRADYLRLLESAVGTGILD